jgi:hypothetical protein
VKADWHHRKPASYPEIKVIMPEFRRQSEGIPKGKVKHQSSWLWAMHDWGCPQQRKVSYRKATGAHGTGAGDSHNPDVLILDNGGLDRVIIDARIDPEPGRRCTIIPHTT